MGVSMRKREEGRRDDQRHKRQKSDGICQIVTQSLGIEHKGHTPKELGNVLLYCT